MSGNRLSTKHLWGFLALTYGLSWLCWIPAGLSGQDVTTSTWLIPYVLGGFGPSVAGLVFVYRNNDQDGRRDFWKRVISFRRISAGWYLFILLIFPILFGLSILFSALLGQTRPGFEGVAAIVANPFSLVGMLVIGVVTGPLSEELGWRGFALDQLQMRLSPLISSLVIGLFWWGWHMPLFIMKGTTQYQWGLGTVRFWQFLLGVMPLSVLMTWVYNKNDRSILAVILLHFTYNFTPGLLYPFSAEVFLYQVVLLFMVAVGVVTISDGLSEGR